MPSPLAPVRCFWCEESMRQPLYMSNSTQDGEGHIYHPDCLKLAREVWKALLAS